MAASTSSGGNFGADAGYCVGVRGVLCRHHGGELEIPLYATRRFLDADYILLECGGMAFSKAGFRVFRCGSKVRAFEIHHS